MKTEAAFDGRALAAGLPALPGVYRMLDAGRQVIYVGKALDLRKRVGSYFQKGAHSPRVRLMLSRVEGVETTVTRTEGEALLLENNLIKTLRPRYNILFRDDKSYPYIVLSKHPYPRLSFHRGALAPGDRSFGPYPNAGAVRESIQLLQKVFRLRSCEDTVFAHRDRPCLLYQIRRCSAPCVGLVGEAAYAADVRNAARFLEGRQGEVLQELNARMERAAAALAFEEAALLRDQLHALAQVQARQFVESSRPLDADILACAEEGGAHCIALALVRGGRQLGARCFFPHNAEGGSPREVLEAFVAQHYAEQAPPPLVLCAERLAAEAAAALAARGGRLMHRLAGERRVWAEMALENARLSLRQRLAEHASQEARALALAQALGLPAPPGRIECFDVSHTMGEAPVGACVVYDRLALRPGEYRRFNLAPGAPGDDPAALREALTRRYQKLAAGEGRLPDLLLIDGGRAQLGVAAQVLADLGLGELAVVGVAKGEGRKPGLERLVFPGAREPLQLPRDHPGLHLVQQIRDEAHRFAISGHRARRGKARTHSLLEEVPGIGARRRQRLLSRFGGLRGVLAASVDELAQVEGVSRALALRIHGALH